MNDLYISIHALREEGDLDLCDRGSGYRVISIHALREEGDAGSPKTRTGFRNISIHALREEGDLNGVGVTTAINQFLSTPSARRATSQLCRPAPADRISIHALREEGDRSVETADTRPPYFYPRPPRGGRPALAHRM